MKRIAFLCCHLTGTGHLVRTLALAHAARDAGAEVRVFSGGRPLGYLDTGGLDVVQLPPVEVRDFDFSQLHVPGGGVAGPDYLETRQAALRDEITGFRPDALVTELYPLGRRVLATEFECAIGAARQANREARIICSVRDIPEPPKKPGRLEQVAERLRTTYDAVLVHGDAGFLPVYAAWPLPNDLTPRIFHTGYVGGALASDTEDGTPVGETVLVAGGGGILGRRLIAIAAEAAGLSSDRMARPWHLLTGGGAAEEEARQLALAHPSPNLTIESVRSDYRTLLAQAACSVSLSGYNTVMDLLACDTPAIVVPFAEKGEREQVIRASGLAGLPGFTVLDTDALTPASLANAVAAAIAGPRRAPTPIARDGAARAVAKILELTA